MAPAHHSTEISRRAHSVPHSLLRVRRFARCAPPSAHRRVPPALRAGSLQPSLSNGCTKFTSHRRSTAAMCQQLERACGPFAVKTKASTERDRVVASLRPTPFHALRSVTA